MCVFLLYTVCMIGALTGTVRDAGKDMVVVETGGWFGMQLPFLL